MEVERDFFGDLPSEITTNILSRLPIRSLAISKSVCKPWLNLIDSDDFEFKTPPALAALLTENTMNSTWSTIYEIEDEDEVDAERSHHLRFIPLTDSDIPHPNRGFTEGITANGLLLLYSLSTTSIPVYICNLITREYTELSCPEDYIPDNEFNFGFGVSKISGQYKVLCINRVPKSDSGHQVYTLGTGTWRRVEAGASSGFKFFGQNLVLNGILHWIVSDLSDNLWICGFDVETECFRIFSAPPENGDKNLDLSVLRDCLCCSYTWDDEIFIWMMKEYQVEDSWTMQYKLSTIGFEFELEYVYVLPIKYFKDGDILLLVDGWDLLYYSNKTRTFQQVGMSKDATAYLNYLIFTPSFFSLKNFGFENVISF